MRLLTRAPFLRRLSDITDRFAEKLAARVEVRGEDECWEWQGGVSDTGYGMVTVAIPAHRLAYLIEHGKIAEHLVIDHVCENKRCCNPRHLEEVTQDVNVQRAARNLTHCRSGRHEWTEENTYTTPDGRRQCRGCRRECYPNPLPDDERRPPGASKLTFAVAEEIRQRAAQGETQRALALEYAIDAAQVSRIVRGEAWTRRWSSSDS